MKRKLILAGAGLAGLLAYMFLWSPGTGAPPCPEMPDPVEAATLVVRGVSLLQGEKGFEFWRLKAEWAAMHQEGDVIEVREPKVRYTLGEGGDEDYVYVSSDLGQVTDGQRILTLWQHVRLTRGDVVVTGPKLVYTADDRIVLFLDGAELDSPEISGTFARLRWSMGRNRIDGEEGIDVTFKARVPRMGADED